MRRLVFACALAVIVSACTPEPEGLATGPSSTADTTATSEAEPTGTTATPTSGPSPWQLVPTADLQVQGDGPFEAIELHVVGNTFVAISDDGDDGDGSSWSTVRAWHSTDGRSWTEGDLAAVVATVGTPAAPWTAQTESGLFVGSATDGGYTTDDGVSWRWVEQISYRSIERIDCEFLSPYRLDGSVAVHSVDACAIGFSCTKPPPLEVTITGPDGTEVASQSFEIDRLLAVGFADDSLLAFATRSVNWTDPDYTDPPPDTQDFDPECWQNQFIDLGYLTFDVATGSWSEFVVTPGSPHTYGLVGGNINGTILLGTDVYSGDSTGRGVYELAPGATEPQLYELPAAAVQMPSITVETNGETAVALAIGIDQAGSYLAGVYVRDAG